MKKYIIGILLIFVLLISACSSMDPLALVKANSQVQQFLKDYPNADFLMTRLNAEHITDENAVAKEICGIELEEKPHYKVKIMDPDSDLEIYAYIDIDTEDMVCLRKIGKEVVEKIVQEKEHKEEKEYEKEHEEIYECNSPDDCKGMNHDMCEGYWKCLDHKCKWICKKTVEEYECKQASDCEGKSHDACEGEWYCKEGYCKWKCYEIEKECEIAVNCEGKPHDACEGEWYCLSGSCKWKCPPVKPPVCKLEGHRVGVETKLYWTKYEGDNFDSYSIVWSNYTPNPVMGEDPVIKLETDRTVTHFKYETPNGTHYYRMNIHLEDGTTYCSSNVVKIMHDEEEPDEVDYEAVLEYGYMTGQEGIVLEWNAYPNNDLSYYKVVWSQTNADLMYPEDSYISVISNAATTRYEVPENKFLNGTNYYRISVIRDGFYSEDDSKRINSNVVTVEKN